MTRENNHVIAVDLCVQNLRTGLVLILAGGEGEEYLIYNTYLSP